MTLRVVGGRVLDELWVWGRAPNSAGFAACSLVGLFGGLFSLAVAAGGVIGVFSIWVVGLPVVLALLIWWMWRRIGVWWDGSVLVVRNRIRTARIDGDEIVAFRARSIDFVPNFPDAIVVWHETDGRIRKTQILATAAIPLGSRIRWWYAAQFMAIGPGLGTSARLVYAPGRWEGLLSDGSP